MIHSESDAALLNQGGLLTVGEAAQAVHVTRGTVKMWIRRGRVVAVRFDGLVWWALSGR